MLSRFFKRPPKHTATRHQLIDEYALTLPQRPGRILTFDGVGDKDVYNPSFISQDGKPYLAARVESRASKWRSNVYDAQTMFFQPKSDDVWEPIPGAPVIDMEDPFATWVHDQGEKWLILGGVKTSGMDEDPWIATVFYKGKDILSLEKEPFVTVRGMKDIRIIELSDQKRKIVCTRPRGGAAGIGMIGVVQITELSQLTPELINSAPLLAEQADKDVKMGPNALYCIQYQHKDHSEEYIGVLGHASFTDSPSREEHYYVVTFCFDPNNPLIHNDWRRPKILAKRSDFAKTEPKEPRLEDVVFPGGIQELDSTTVRLYAGISDAFVGAIDIPHPFAHCHIVND